MEFGRAVSLDVGEKTTEKEFFAPHVCWSIDRVKVDLELSTELARKLDSEKEITFNPILDPSPLLESSTISFFKFCCVILFLAEKGEEEKEAEAEEGKAEEEERVLVRKLDLLLTYLWRVHMVDYYSGKLVESSFDFWNVRFRLLSSQATS